MYLRIFNKLCICYLLMALSTPELALPDRVTERERARGRNKENWRKRWWRDRRGRERQDLKGFQSSLGEERAMPSVSLLPPPCGGCSVSRLKTASDAFRCFWDYRRLNRTGKCLSKARVSDVEDFRGLNGRRSRWRPLRTSHRPGAQWVCLLD